MSDVGEGSNYVPKARFRVEQDVKWTLDLVNVAGRLNVKERRSAFPKSQDDRVEKLLTGLSEIRLGKAEDCCGFKEQPQRSSGGRLDEENLRDIISLTTGDRSGFRPRKSDFAT
jgi:hypothetical protein